MPSTAHIQYPTLSRPLMPKHLENLASVVTSSRSHPLRSQDHDEASLRVHSHPYYICYCPGQGNKSTRSCFDIASACSAKIDGGLTDLWSEKTGVAAATCQGTYLTVGHGMCKSETVDTLGHAGLPHLSYEIYAGIVGDCAWQEGGCPITQQNYIDFVYGTLSELQTSVWPDVNRVIEWWGYIRAWTATGETVPYTNFDDWLHYSHSS
ncbi:hypothetical protein VNI00_011167 [Paramarasmius palmivorus]|uniref:Uncharacterized protein n=1 Tax=Paramarasmius palmivorus TaxID=297713 RepID=A0AAW0CET4_9AGAR